MTATAPPPEIVQALLALRLGEVGQVLGHAVERRGLCGAGAYLLDGALLSAELLAQPAGAPLPRTRQVPAGRPAGLRPIVAAPELLTDAREAVIARRAFRFAHRVFAGGEAVTLSLIEPGPEDEARLRVATIQLASAGLYVERDPSGRQLIVAASRAALHPAPKPSGKRS